MFDGDDFSVDRKTGDTPYIFVPQASMSVTGGIQPGILCRALTDEHRDSGLAARLLLAYPLRMARTWTDAEIDPVCEARYAQTVERLYQLQPAFDDDKFTPEIIGLTAEAQERWKRFFNEHNQELINQNGELAAVLAKLEQYAARFALIFHCVKIVNDKETQDRPDVVDIASLESGIALAQWFANEAIRVYDMLAENSHWRGLRELAEWIERKGGVVTARQVQQGQRQYRCAGEAESVLDNLFHSGFGEWQSTMPGKRGRPTREFVLHIHPTVYENGANPEENGNSVDVDSVDDLT